MWEKSLLIPSYTFILKSHSLDSDLTDLELTEIAGRLDPDKYMFLGVKLGIDKARLNQFKHNNPGDIAGAMATMLIRWRNDQSAPPRVIRKTLSEALEYVERSDLADMIFSKGKRRENTECTHERHKFLKSKVECNHMLVL